LHYITVAGIGKFIGSASALNVDNLLITLHLDRYAGSFCQRIYCIKQSLSSGDCIATYGFFRTRYKLFKSAYLQGLYHQPS